MDTWKAQADEGRQVQIGRRILGPYSRTLRTFSTKIPHEKESLLKKKEEDEQIIVAYKIVCAGDDDIKKGTCMMRDRQQSILLEGPLVATRYGY
jgi:hypothetical protein